MGKIRWESERERQGRAGASSEKEGSAFRRGLRRFDRTCGKWHILFSTGWSARKEAVQIAAKRRREEFGERILLGFDPRVLFQLVPSTRGRGIRTLYF